MFLLDTNICIYLINERDRTLRGRFEANAAEISISSITYAELCYGVAGSSVGRISVAQSDIPTAA